MAKEIVYYEVTHSYGGITKGLRFEVVKDSAKHIDASIREGLEKVTGIPKIQINLGMLQCKPV